jgi:hypothetical protein
VCVCVCVCVCVRVSDMSHNVLTYQPARL